MKVLVGLLLAATIALVQGRTALIKNTARVDVAERPCDGVIYLKVATGNGTIRPCGSSLIAPTWALTSADCINGLTFGWLSMCANVAQQPRVIYEVGQASISRPPGNTANSVALLNFNRDPTLLGIPVIRLNRDVESLENIESRSWHYANGEILTRSSIEHTGRENCVADGSQDDQLFCGYGEAACQAYAGIPLVADEDGSQIGLVAYHSNCDGEARNEDGAQAAIAFISIASYSDWIQSVTGVSFDNSQPEASERETVQVASP